MLLDEGKRVDERKRCGQAAARPALRQCRATALDGSMATSFTLSRKTTVQLEIAATHDDKNQPASYVAAVKERINAG